MNTNETICALASGTGGAICVVRISGDDALAVGNAVWRGRSPLGVGNARKMLLGHAGGDRVLAVYFPHPASYTGEDVVEIHSHGGMRTARAVLKACADAGCRSAEPGEFTFRAFVNGKLDLAQAEAVGDVIDARSETARRVAERQLAGSLSRRIAGLREQLVDCVADCESQLDFSEDVGEYDAVILEKLDAVDSGVSGLLAGAAAGGILRSGVDLVIAGRPNAGKSSLLNRLLGFDRAIVTEVAGTTRDTLEEHVELRGIPVNLTDTAGLRRSSDRVEALGIARSEAALGRAQFVFYLLDATCFAEEFAYYQTLSLPREKVFLLLNKCDLVERVPEAGEVAYPVSAATGQGLEALLDAFAAKVWGGGEDEPEIAVNLRHKELLEKASAALHAARAELLRGSYETASSSLREATSALGEITGDTASPDILGNIFSRFCIGK